MRSVILLAAALMALVAAGCGGSSGGDEVEREAPTAAEFPSAEGKDIQEIFEAEKQSKLVVSPAGLVFHMGDNRFPFGVFTVDRKQVDDADVALYFAKDPEGPVQGPLPARVDSLETKPAYRAQGSGAAGDARSVYVVPDVNFNRSGPWFAVALIKGEDGLEASRLPSPVVDKFPAVPDVGDKAPVIHTPTPEDVGGDIAKIDTRVPPSNQHSVDFADVVGKKPVVLTFATPALCQSRVCGPVVDVNEQVMDEFGDGVEFIHMEVYNDNDPGKGVRPQLKAYGLPSEPWTFVIDKDGVIRTRIEGAYGVDELRDAVAEVAGRAPSGS